MVLWISFGIILIGVNLICFFCGYRQGILIQVSDQRKRMAEQIQYQNFMECKQIIKQNNIPLENYFINRNQNRIAVYGLGQYYFEILLNFDTSKFETIYLGDRNKLDKQESVSQTVYTIDELVKKPIDAVLVTSILYYDEIRKEFTEKGMKCPIISYEDLVYNAKKEL